ncbi:MAG: cyclic nucleotide-binding domain-containing protein [Alcanivoracaceae bacterium]|jgi:signal-transduction protein with cAMP-binding, CBS, and nucleotidyltransferase domain|nr:cyclic nucleotide-binding domain-containing protein [Alcanivoracaceae bacterium]
MISLAEPTPGFSALMRQYKRLVNELLQGLSLVPESVSLNASNDLLKSGMSAGKTYLIKTGMVGVRSMDRRLFTWDEGDLILPDAAPDSADSMQYVCEGPVILHSFDTLELVRTALASPETARLWTRLLMTQQSILLRLLAAQSDADTQTTPGFAYYQPGDVIIGQGDRPDYVFSLFEGSADVIVDDVVVGEVGEGEVLGALAVLTHSPRSATVRARTRCSVVKVPKDQFKTLIRSNPTMIHGLMTDMARQIKKLNEKVVQLSSPASN